MATRCGEARVVYRLLRHGLPVDVSDGAGRTALHLATMHNRTDVAKQLLYGGADMNRQDVFGDTPWHNAARFNSTKVARLLLDEGVDLIFQLKCNQTPLDYAHKGSKIERLLLELQQSAPERYSQLEVIASVFSYFLK